MGVPRQKELDKVKHRMANEVKEVKHLLAVKDSLDPMDIEKALARAKDLELPTLGSLEGLPARVQKLKKQLPLVKAMQSALEKEDFETLSLVMETIKKEGLDKAPENWLPELKGGELAGQVYNAMESVKAKKKMEDIEVARKAEIQKQVLGQEKQANQANAFVAEEPKPEVQKRKKTITGFSEEDQSRVLIGLIQAAKEFDVGALETGLSEATKQGIDSCETLDVAEECFQKLQTEAFLITKMKEKSELIVAKDCDPANLKALQNLVNQAKRLQVAEEAVSDVKQAQQDAVRRRARSTIHGACFDNVALDEMHLVEGEFSDLADYGGLKDPTRWRGHRAATYFSKGERGPEVMLKHNKNELKEGLTKVLYAQEAQSCQNFRTILGWMSDRPIPESQRLGYAQDIVEVAKTHQGLANETYVQLMKQLTHNPSDRSRLLGWKLMLLLCQQVRPSNDLEEFVRTFLMKSLRSESHEAVVAVKQCIADLNVLVNPEKIAQANAADEDGSSKELIPIQVLLIDHSTRKVHAPKSATLTELAQRVAGQLRVSNASDFSFFQLTEGLETHRLLPDTTVLSTLAQKWDKLKEVTGRASHLLFKRRFMRVDEMLNPGDLVHATLTYRQAMWDYLHYPVSEEGGHICEIAASILMTEYDHYKDMIESSKLGEPGILEQLIPETSLKHDQKRAKWATQVLASFRALQSMCDPGENRILKMSRVLSLLQRLKLFGAYFWLGRQTMQVPAEKVSVPEAPPQMCKINTKAPDCEYWICVDLFGVRFVSVDSAPGHGFQRGFLFNEEAVERVLCWGARQNIVQFVVSTVNPAAPTAGRVPMTIALISPAAVDIAYAVHVIHKTQT